MNYIYLLVIIFYLVFIIFDTSTMLRYDSHHHLKQPFERPPHICVHNNLGRRHKGAHMKILKRGTTF
jgi:hypothetical protein